MEQPPAVQQISKLNQDVNEAILLYEEAVKLVEATFNKLTQSTISEGLLPYQQKQAENHRGLAIRKLACLLSTMQNGDIAKSLREIEADLYHMNTFMRCSSSSVPEMSNAENKS